MKGLGLKGSEGTVFGGERGEEGRCCRGEGRGGSVLSRLKGTVIGWSELMDRDGAVGGAKVFIHVSLVL